MEEILEDTICLGAHTLVTLIAETIEKGSRAKTSPYLLERRTKGRFAKDFQDLTHDKRRFHENFHMSIETFELLLSMIESHLQPKKNTRPNDFISAKEKLAIVLEYYACGTLQRHVSSVYRISKQHFGLILDQVSDAICASLKNEIPPLTPENMLQASEDYFNKWNFPNCVGALDGKHVAIKCPKKSGSLFYNYKGFFSIVLMAASDANYKFTYVDIGAYGSEGDASVFAESTLGAGIFKKTLKFPLDQTVGLENLPFFFVGDDAFPLNARIMKPFVPQKGKKLTPEESILNYRLSRARRCVENAFGILCSKFYCLQKKMFCGPNRAPKILSACCYLHNFHMRVNKDSYCPENYADSYNHFGEVVEGYFHRNLPDNSLFTSEYASAHLGNHPHSAKMVREKIKLYVNSEMGSIPWQNKAAYLD